MTPTIDKLLDYSKDNGCIVKFVMFRGRIKFLEWQGLVSDLMYKSQTSQLGMQNIEVVFTDIPEHEGVLTPTEGPIKPTMYGTSAPTDQPVFHPELLWLLQDTGLDVLAVAYKDSMGGGNVFMYDASDDNHNSYPFSEYLDHFLLTLPNALNLEARAEAVYWKTWLAGFDERTFKFID